MQRNMIIMIVFRHKLLHPLMTVNVRPNS
jgi:hypothetical protein